MNVHKRNELPTKDDLLFDRLADGELSESERRELLAGLDREPGAWRRCALAFLEAQSWRQELGGLRQEAGPQAEEPRRFHSGVSRRTPRLPRYGGTLLAMAASFLAALWLGSMIDEARDTPRPGTAGPRQLAGVEDGRTTVEAPRPEGISAEAPAQADRGSGPWEVVTVSVPEGLQGIEGPIRLPALARDRFDEQWLRNLPPVVPDDVVGALKRTGHEVRQRREWLPLRMQDGRQLVVPIDNVDVHYLGGPTY